MTSCLYTFLFFLNLFLFSKAQLTADIFVWEGGQRYITEKVEKILQSGLNAALKERSKIPKPILKLTQTNFSKINGSSVSIDILSNLQAAVDTGPVYVSGQQAYVMQADLTCLRWSDDGHLRYKTPANNDPTFMTLSVCAKSCKSVSYQYAAVEQGSYCFCGNSPPDTVAVAADQPCDISCIGDPSQICGGPNGEATFADLSSFAAADEHGGAIFSLTARPSEALVNGDQVSFSISTRRKTDDLTFAFDYGDGTPTTPYGRLGSVYFRKIYRNPGAFTVTTYIISDNNEIFQASAQIRVEMALDGRLDCPNKQGQCDLTMNFGSNLSLRTTASDSAPMLDPAYFWTPAANTFSKVKDGLFISNAEFDDSGLLLGIEYGYTEIPYNFDLQLACPPPAIGQSDHCDKGCSGTASRLCPASANVAYCAKRDTCISNQMGTCPNSDPEYTYVTLPAGPWTTAGGSRWINVTTLQQRVKPGCRMAIAASDSALFSNDNFFIRAFAYRPTVVTVNKPKEQLLATISDGARSITLRSPDEMSTSATSRPEVPPKARSRQTLKNTTDPAPGTAASVTEPRLKHRPPVGNEPASGGQCSVNPSEGTAVTRSFHVECSNWPNSDDVAEFCVYAKDLDNGQETSLYCAPVVNQDISLMQGSYALWVNATDRSKAITRSKIGQVNVQAATSAPSASDFLATLAANVAERNLAKTLAFVASAAKSANENGLMPGLDGFWQSGNCTTGYDKRECDRIHVSGVVNNTLTLDNYLECVRAANNCLAEYRSQAAKIRAKMLQAVDSFPVSTLGDVHAFADTVNVVLAKLDEINIDGQESANHILDKMTSAFAILEQSSSLESVLQAATALFETTVTMNHVTHYALDNEPVLDDQLRLQKEEYENYDTSLPEDPRDIRFFDEMTFDEWGVDAAKRAQKKWAASMALSIQRAVDAIAAAVLRNLALGDDSVVFRVPSGGLMEVQYSTIAEMGNFSLPSRTEVGFPDICLLTGLPACQSSTPIQRKIVYYDKNLHQYADRDQEVTSGSLEIEFFDPETKKVIPVSNSSSPVILRFAQSQPVQSKSVVPILSSREALKVHRVPAKSSESTTLHLELTPANRKAAFGIFIRYASPQSGFYVGTYSDEYDRSLVLGPGQYGATVTLEPSSDGTADSSDHCYYYIGVAQLASASEANGTDIGNWTILRKFTNTYSLSISTHSCHFFSPKTVHWLKDGCRTSLNSDHKTTECECSHLTIFGGGLIVPPNQINFGYVFTHGSFDQNVSIYVAVLTIFTIYVMFVFWARMKDKEDVDKLACIPMPDNDIRDKYVYELVVVTGSRKAAATDSRVSIIIAGDQGETDIREFGHPDGPRRIFRRGMTNHFVLTTPRPLGDLQYLRVWHDNSGPGEYAGWFLKEIAVLDLQTHARYPFVCNQWLATEKGDGKIERTIARSTDEELSRFARIFSLKAKNDLSDEHLWFSVFTRAPGSRFTRVERVTCCLSLLTTAMLASAVWYGTAQSSNSPNLIRSGPFSLSMAEIGVGIMTSIMVFPPNFLIIFLFRKAAPRRKQQSRIEKVLKQTSTLSGRNVSRSALGKKKKPFTLPWWCRVVAWFLLVCVIMLSVVFTVFYAIQMGDTGARRWLTSLVTSFFSSMLITEPLQIFLMAVFCATMCRKSALKEESDWIVDQEDFALGRSDGVWVDGDDSSFNRMNPMDQQYLESKKQDRLKQLRMYDVVRETAVYAFFLWTIFMLVYGSRDTASCIYKNNLEATFVKPKVKSLQFDKRIREVSQFWTWAREVLAPGLRASTWYNSKPALGERGFLADRTNRILGFATMRQIRSKPRLCSADQMNKTGGGCFDFRYTNYFDEDNLNYGMNWTLLGDGEETAYPEYTYKTADQLKNLPTLGDIDYYSGGGYVVDLIGSISDLQSRFSQLERQGWIDRNTRAIIIEFSCFDANANLFGANFIMAEIPVTGGLIPSAKFKSLVLLPYNSGFAIVQVILQAIFVLFILIYLVKEARKMFCSGFCTYWCHGWNYVEIFIILASLGAVAIYVLRYWETQACIELFEKTNGNQYISIQYAAAFDEAFTSVAAFLVFFAVTKFAHLLRFNQRIEVMHTTLARCRIYFFNYSVVFFVLFLAFCMAFYMLFHQRFAQYASFVRTLETGFTFLLSHGDYEPLSKASPVLAPMFIALFTLVMTILMINVFLTSVMAIFIGVKHDSKLQGQEHEVVSFFKIKTRQVLGMAPLAEHRTALGDYRYDDGVYYEMEKKLAKITRKINNMCADAGVEITDTQKQGRVMAAVIKSD